MGRHKFLTDRDKDVLTNLYNLGAMNMDQICDICFVNSHAYGRKRIYELKKRELIFRVKNGCYRITGKGIGELEFKSSTTPARKLFNPLSIDRRIRLSEIAKTLHNYNWNFLGSRLVKADYNLNRGCLIEGILFNKITKEQYIIYLLNKNPLRKTIRKIKSEVSKMCRIGLCNVIIFCLCEDGYNSFMDNSSYGANCVHLLPHGYALVVLPYLTDPNWLKVLAHYHLGACPVRGTDEHHADLIAEIDGKEVYLSEMITYDKIKRHHLINYGPDAVAKDGRAVILFTTESISSNIEDFSETFTAYKHIRVITVEDSYFEKYPPTPAHNCSINSGRLSSALDGI